MERFLDFIERYGNACILSMPILGIVILCMVY